MEGIYADRFYARRGFIQHNNLLLTGNLWWQGFAEEGQEGTAAAEDLYSGNLNIEF